MLSRSIAEFWELCMALQISWYYLTKNTCKHCLKFQPHCWLSTEMYLISMILIFMALRRILQQNSTVCIPPMLLDAMFLLLCVCSWRHLTRLLNLAATFAFCIMRAKWGITLRASLTKIATLCFKTSSVFCTTGQTEAFLTESGLITFKTQTRTVQPIGPIFWIICMALTNGIARILEWEEHIDKFRGYQVKNSWWAKISSCQAPVLSTSCVHSRTNYLPSYSTDKYKYHDWSQPEWRGGRPPVTPWLCQWQIAKYWIPQQNSIATSITHWCL